MASASASAASTDGRVMSVNAMRSPVGPKTGTQNLIAGIKYPTKDAGSVPKAKRPVNRPALWPLCRRGSSVGSSLDTSRPPNQETRLVHQSAADLVIDLILRRPNPEDRLAPPLLAPGLRSGRLLNFELGAVMQLDVKQLPRLLDFCALNGARNHVFDDTPAIDVLEKSATAMSSAGLKCFEASISSDPRGHNK